jgi:hypothetical protein
MKLLKYPPPYRAWLTLCSDPDSTTIEAWRELDELLWQKLKLPFGDSFFLVSHNISEPEQVSVERFPAIIAAHPHDTMHTWGDYEQAPGVSFTRADAERGRETMSELGIQPLIWTDHSAFVGNILHNPRRPPAPQFSDASGYTIENFDYTLDLIHDAGVRYLWDGTISSVVGQDRAVSRPEWYGYRKLSDLIPVARALLDRLGKPLWNLVGATRFTYTPEGNRQYRRMAFEGGLAFYVFHRFGTWGQADIDGLGELLSADNMDRLVRARGTSIVYTHLGKRLASRRDDKTHIPPATVKAFEGLAKRFEAGEIMLSSTSELLDYLVIRDHVTIKGRTLQFRSDGLRFKDLNAQDLSKYSWGIQGNTADLIVECDGEELPYRLTPSGRDVSTLTILAPGAE